VRRLGGGNGQVMAAPSGPAANSVQMTTISWLKSRPQMSIPLHYDCVVCQAQTSPISAATATEILLLMLLRDTGLKEIYVNLCFSHRRKIDECLKLGDAS
jgi:hypothetical protein